MQKTASSPIQWQQFPIPLLYFLLGVFALGLTVDGGIYSVLQNLYLLRLGYGPEFVGIFNAVGLFIFALISLPIGSIKRWSSRQLLLFGSLISLVGLLLIPAAQWTAPPVQPLLLIAGRTVSLMGLAFFFIHSPPFIMSITSGVWQDRGLAWQTAVLALAGFSGGLLGGYLPGWISAYLGLPLTNPTPYQLPLIFAATAMLLVFIAIALAGEPTAPPALPEEETAVSPEQRQTRHKQWQGPLWLYLTLLVIVRILQVAIVGALITFGNVYFDDGLRIATDQIGIATALGRLASIPVALSIPYLFRRWSHFNLTVAVTLLAALSALPLALTDIWPLAAAGYILTTAVGPLRYLAFLLFAMSLVTPRQRAIITGTSEMAIGMGLALVSFAGGYIIDWYGYSTFFGLTIALSTFGTFLYWLIFYRYR